MTLPRIGVTAWFRDLETFLGPTPLYTVNRWYVDAVRAAGGLPLVLIPVEDVDAVLDSLDGVLLSGGSDIEPSVYGEERHPRTQDADVERDWFELALARRAVERDVPLLAICRGIQSLNVALGGTLHQHIPDVSGDEGHDRIDAPREAVHDVVLAPGSRLAAIYGGSRRIPVNSMHHQNVAAIGEGLVPVATVPEGGLVEGLEHPYRRFCVAVQWHPETIVDVMPEQRRLFEAFVAACR